MTAWVVRGSLAAALFAVAAVAGPTHAQGTDISGQVESVVKLSLERGSPQVVRATVSSTVPGTGLSVSQQGRPTRALRSFREPVTNARVTARGDASAAGVVYQTFTFGPQTP